MLAIFAEYDAKGEDNLWVTDGTGAGTSELTVGGSSAFGLVPRDFVVLGTRALFIGDGSSGSDELWVTDGTAAGTIQLVGVFDPQSITVFRTIITRFSPPWTRMVIIISGSPMAPPQGLRN